ncbi:MULTISPECIES: DUF5999 family protein [unclassified Streptomyces]|uniref:DUF5999 family protein n=1 Tax=unclassified Streptomyces TaxID=2593676 RepID=UPI0036EA45CE
MSLLRLGRRPASSPSVTPRSVIAAAEETLSMVLSDGAPTPETDQDVHDLMLRLRGHLMQLGAMAPDRSRAVAEVMKMARQREAEVPDSCARALMPLAKFATAVRTVLWTLRAEGALCEHSPPCPPASAADHLAASVLVGHPEAGWSVLCNGVILFEDTGYLLPTGGAVGPRRPQPGGAVTT